MKPAKQVFQVFKVLTDQGIPPKNYIFVIVKSKGHRQTILKFSRFFRKCVEILEI